MKPVFVVLLCTLTVATMGTIVAHESPWRIWFELGKEAYDRKNWRECIVSMQHMQRELKREMEECQESCNSKFSHEGQSVYYLTEPLFYIQFASWKGGNVRKAYLAGAELLRLSPNRAEILKNQEYFEEAYPDIISEIDEEDEYAYPMHLHDRSGDFLPFYTKGVNAYNNEEWGNVVVHMETALATAKIRHDGCEEKCNLMNAEASNSKFYEAEPLNYIQCSEYSLGNIYAAAVAAEEYLTIVPSDRSMQWNLEFYETQEAYALQKEIAESTSTLQQLRLRDYSATNDRVLVMTVATHEEHYLELLEDSLRARDRSPQLLVAGRGEEFKGYGWKLKKVLEVLKDVREEFDIVILTDAFDVLYMADLDEIIEKFRKFDHPMVVSGEVNCWPYPDWCASYPESKGLYPYINSGGYIGEIPYIIDLLEGINITHRSDCVDDQGELTRIYLDDPTSMIIDSNAVIFQNLYGRGARDLQIMKGKARPQNVATKTEPCIIHANGWDKTPLFDYAKHTGLVTAEDAERYHDMADRISGILKKRESKINRECSEYNPNPSIHPEWNALKEYRLIDEKKFLRNHLKKLRNDFGWLKRIDQEVNEVQEYRTLCGDLWSPYFHTSAPKIDRCPSSFKIYVYPDPPENTTVVYKEILRILSKSPYITTDPSEACLFIPSVDVSCWCENCMFGAFDNVIDRPHPESVRIQKDLQALPYWNRGKNHVLFELSDSPCITYDPQYAIVAKSGLSEFHFRRKHDVSMPLFPMVEFDDDKRKTPASDRQYLITFRGTRSPRSDALRKYLPQLHNGEDVLMLIACRWFGHRYDKEGYDQDCAAQEEEFNKYTYTELATQSKFSLIVEGFGYHSFRLTEIMGAGSIPVIVVDHYELPYSDILDWSTFSVRIPEHQLLNLTEILRAIPEETVQKMQETALFVYEHFMRSLDLQLLTAIESIRINRFSNNAELDKVRLMEDGLPFPVPEEMAIPLHIVEAKCGITPLCNVVGEMAVVGMAVAS